MHSLPANPTAANPGQARSRAAGATRRHTGRAFAAILAWWRRSRSRAAERRALAELSDWGLRDIGLTRAEADGEFRKWSWRL